MNNIKFAKINGQGIIPTKEKEDGCYDLYVYFKEDQLKILSHEIKNIPISIKSMFDNKYRIGIRERGSNTVSKLKVVAGQIDSSYRGEWFLSLYNTQHYPIIIDKNVDKCIYEYNGDETVCLRVPYKKALAQFAIEEVPNVIIEEVLEIEIDNSITKRGVGKLGSSGK